MEYKFGDILRENPRQAVSDDPRFLIISSKNLGYLTGVTYCHTIEHMDRHSDTITRLWIKITPQYLHDIIGEKHANTVYF